MDVNKQIIVGNVGKEPEFHTFGNDGEVAKFTVATTRKFKDKSGEKQEQTEWHRIVTFNKGLIGFIKKYIDKGTRVYLEGEQQTRKYTDKDGNDKYITETILPNFTGRIEVQARFKGSDDNAGQPQSSNTPAPNAGGYDDFDDDIPF